MGSQKFLHEWLLDIPKTPRKQGRNDGFVQKLLATHLVSAEGAMRLPRMTTRRWIFAVVIAATLLEGYRELRLSRQYRLKAQMHAGREGPQQVKVGAGFYGYSLPSPELAVYHTAMRKKYEQAATRPWASVEPDPPAPK